jgi:hypothetical protein
MDLSTDLVPTKSFAFCMVWQSQDMPVVGNRSRNLAGTWQEPGHNNGHTINNHLFLNIRNPASAVIPSTRLHVTCSHGI